jgi:hypothetical protein
VALRAASEYLKRQTPAPSQIGHLIRFRMATPAGRFPAFRASFISMVRYYLTTPGWPSLSCPAPNPTGQ